MTTLEAKRHVDAVVDRALFGLDTSVMSAETLRKTTKLLLGFAVGDEGLIREVGYDLDLLRRLSFRVHKETSEQCADGTLGEDHPVVFLARFAHRRTSCFDVTIPDANRARRRPKAAAQQPRHKVDAQFTGRSTSPGMR